MIEPSDIFAAVFFAGMAVAIAIRWRHTRHHRKIVVAERRREPAVWIFIFLWGVAELLPFLAVFTTWLAFADYAMPIGLSAVGVPVFGAGLWLLWRSHADLGENWSPTLVIRLGHKLVTNGIYATIRHPMYAAHWLWVIAQGLLIHNWIAGPAGLIVFAPLYFLRVGSEEAQLRAHFGAAYRDYERRTGRLFPRFGRPTL